MKALILAGGRGTRLLPYTTIIPKPLMPVGNRPILEILLLQLKAVGITDIVIAVGYLSHLLRAYFGNGERLGIKLSYVEESTPLGTAGPIGLALDRLGDRFLLMNGDLLTSLNFSRLLDFHAERMADATIGAYAREIKIDFGVLKVDGDQRLMSYDEKPTINYSVSMGVYVLERSAVEDLVSPLQRLDAPDLMRALQNSGKKVVCFQDSCFWLDIGRPEDYQLANEVLEKGNLVLGFPID